MSIFNRFRSSKNIKLSNDEQMIVNHGTKTITLMIREDMFSWDKMVEFSKHSNQEFYKKVRTIYRCVRMIIKNGSTLPIALMKRGATKDKDVEITDHPLLNMLHGRTNSIQSGTSFLNFYGSSYLINGNAYARLAGTKERPLALFPLFPQNVEAKENDNQDEPIKYEYLNSKGKIEPIPYDEMWHTMDYNPDSLLTGLSPISVASLTAEMQHYSEQWNRNMIKQGGKIPFVIRFKGNLTDEQFKNAEARIRSTWEGSKNINKIQLMDGDATIEKIGMTPQDMDWINTQKLTTREIANIYGIDSSLLNDVEAKTFANRTDARRALYTETIFPLMQEIYNSLSFFLFYDNKMGRTTHYIRIKREDVEVLKVNFKEMAEATKGLWALTPNQVLKILGLDTDSDPLMDKRYVPANMIPMDELGGALPE